MKSFHGTEPPTVVFWCSWWDSDASLNVSILIAVSFISTTLPQAMAYLSFQGAWNTERSVGKLVSGNVETEPKVFGNTANMVIICKTSCEFIPYDFEWRVIYMISHWESMTLEKVMSYIIKLCFTLKNAWSLSLLYLQFKCKSSLIFFWKVAK